MTEHTFVYILVSTGKFPVSPLVGVFVGTLLYVLHRQSLSLRGHFRRHLLVHSCAYFREHFHERVRRSDFAVRVLCAFLSEGAPGGAKRRWPSSVHTAFRADKQGGKLRGPASILFTSHDTILFITLLTTSAPKSSQKNCFPRFTWVIPSKQHFKYSRTNFCSCYAMNSCQQLFFCVAKVMGSMVTKLAKTCSHSL